VTTAPVFRPATRDDLPALVRMLADDELGATREDPSEPLASSYEAAFAAIERDPNHELIVAVHEGEPAGFLQLTLLPYLTYRGGWRALIESVRVRSDMRGRQLGRALIQHAIERARARACHVVQLTTDKRRPDALRFYEQLGFRATHEGMKLHLERG
jgi:GNAT superfamily N-acetyltransferase